MPAIRDIKVNFSKLTGQQQLLFRSMTAADGLSQLFEFNLDVLSESHTIDLDSVLGQEMSVSAEATQGPPRHFHGYVTSFSYVGADGSYAAYRAVLRPHLWKLTRTAESRVFQKQKVPDIVLDLLKNKHGIVHLETDFGHENRGDYLPWDYCVQYRETDYNFIARLLEYEGIHYFFKHEADKHTLVLTDSLARHSTVKGYEEIPFRNATNDDTIDEGIWSWNATRVVLPGTFATGDWDFTTPTAKLYRTSGSDVERKHAKGKTPDYEIYDQPEPIVQQTGYAPARVEDYARMRIEELHAKYEVISADSNARGLYAGALFKVTDGPRTEMADTKYLVIESDAFLQVDAYRSGGSSNQMTYKGSIRAINSKHHFRPPRTAHKPLIQGLQSATVVGTAGEKVDTDKYGRVRVQFHWDREGKNNEHSSCWVRVSQNWAGANWGGMFLPHLGQEVLVGFMEGDPDRPIVVGRVYNANNMPPFNLPDHKLKSIIRDHYGNEIVMDGTQGKESISIYSPNHHSLLQLGKSYKVFTSSTDSKLSIDTESYSLGWKISMTKGWSFSVDRGAWLSVKAGIGTSITLGVDASASVGVKGTFAFGGQISYSKAWNFSYGLSREFKATKGAYKRVSSSDAILDSQADCYVTGGKNDNTMLMSNDKEIILSFCENEGREEDMKKADKAATAAAMKMMAAVTAASVVSAIGQNWLLDKDGSKKNRANDDQTIQTQFASISKSNAADAAIVLASAAATRSAIKGAKDADFKPPKHPEPTAKVALDKEGLRAFAGKGQEAELVMANKGTVDLMGNAGVDIKTKDGKMTLFASKELLLSSHDGVRIDCELRHKNMTVLK